MRELNKRADLCCINTGTLGYREPIEVTAERIATQGFGWITPWRQEIDETNPQVAASAIQKAGLKVHAYCRTAYFTANDAAGRRIAIDSNRRALETAAVLGASMLVAVVGGLPVGSRNIEDARAQIFDGLAALQPTIEETGVSIALEPLHPVYATDRSVLNTLDQALDWCDQLDPSHSGHFGVVIDAYHVWWDPTLMSAIARAGDRIRALHVCDWLVNTRDRLQDRGMMGDGVIDLKRLRAAVEAAGYDGPVEVEIFSKLDWWHRPADETLRICRNRLFECC